jgi:amidohydrolase
MCLVPLVTVALLGASVPLARIDPVTAPANHSPLFQGDDAAWHYGVRTMSSLAMDFLRSGGMLKGTP